jgi:hypothetical protein
MSPMSKPIILSLATAMSNVVAANAGDYRHVDSQDNQKSWDDPERGERAAANDPSRSANKSGS